MENETAKHFFETALDYSNKNYSDELAWARNRSIESFRQMTFEQFLYQYCWVIYASGFRVSVVKNKFEALAKAFKDFDSDKLYHMQSIEPALAVINNVKKANSFLRGVKLVYEEGYPQFKARVLRQGMHVLRELPGIGEITQKHLARNLGVLDVSKDDIWLVRLAQTFKARSVEELVSFLANAYGEKQGVIDLVLWRFCADDSWKTLGLSDLDEYITSLNSPILREERHRLQMTTHTFTAVIHREDNLYVAQCPEVGTISQGETIEEAIANLKEATELYLEEFPAPEVDRPILTTFEAAVYA